MLARLLAEGARVSPRDQDTLELLGVQVQIEDYAACVIYHPARKLNYRFMVAEWLWIITGRDELRFLTQFNREMTKFSDDGFTLSGAYGPRLHERQQFDYVVDLLKRDPSSRQAVMSIWRPSPEPSKDIPCTLTLQALVRGGSLSEEPRLHLIVNMRSSDAWLGLPYDIFCFSMIGRALADSLGVAPGHLVINLGSSHLYAKHAELATIALDRPDYFAERTVECGDLTGIWREPLEYFFAKTPVKEPDPYDCFRRALTAKTSVEAMYAIYPW